MKIGEYVRTKYGVIAKITNIIEDLFIDCDIDVYYEDSLKDNSPMMEIPYNLKNEYIIKSSPNIIDLIEVGDYVNGSRVIEVSKDKETGYVSVEYSILGKDEIMLALLYDEDSIKTIVTKEQFSSMEYKVGEE